MTRLVTGRIAVSLRHSAAPGPNTLLSGRWRPAMLHDNNTVYDSGKRLSAAGSVLYGAVVLCNALTDTPATLSNCCSCSAKPPDALACLQ